MTRIYNEGTHTCCNNENGSQGCQIGPHVYKEEDQSRLAKLIPFIKPPRIDQVRYAQDIIGLDCEMCYTKAGMEVIKICVVIRFCLRLLI